jgi:hypothetical protein
MKYSGVTMLKFGWVLLSSLISFSAIAGVSFEEKRNRVEYLEDLGNKSMSMNVDAYRRELQYEKRKLSFDKRAENEANLLAESVKIQVQRAYEAALEKMSPSEASSEVKEAIEKDLTLVAPELQDDIRQIALNALENKSTGGLNAEEKLDGLEVSMLKGVQERSEFLNMEAESETPRVQMLMDLSAIRGPMTGNEEANKKDYDTKAEMLASLVSDRASTRWVATSNIALRSDAFVRNEATVNIQFKVDFLGVAIEAGPTITFNRDYSTSIAIGVEGLHPPLLPDGNFDFAKRDTNGNPVMKDGQVQKRFVNFTCEASLIFWSAYKGTGGFSIAGTGGKVSSAKEYSNQVYYASRRIAVPESVENKTVTYENLLNICNKEFLPAKVTNNMTVSMSLNMTMKNMLSGLRFSHPKTTCATDSQCTKWFNNGNIALLRANNTPRCIEDSVEKFRTCELRGLKGQNCTVFDKTGKAISEQKNEYKCDAGLTCVKVSDGGWLKGWAIYKHAKGICQ